MQRLNARLALLWALVPAAWAEEKLPGVELFKDEKKHLESLIKSAQDISTEMESATAQLVDLRAEYAKGTDPAELADRRRALRFRTQSLLERLAAVDGEYRLRNDTYEAARIGFGFQSIANEKAPPPKIDAELGYIHKLVQFSDRFTAVRRSAQEELSKEETAFEEARRSARTRAIWTWILLQIGRAHV